MTYRIIISLLLAVLGSAAAAYARGGGGCLRQGTSVLTPQGEVAIETLRVGDSVYCVLDGQRRVATVQACFRVDGGVYRRLDTPQGSIYATPEHPVMVAPGEFRAAGRLRAGQTVFLWQDGRLQSTTLLAAEEVASDLPAYNLLVSPGGTFIADGVVVHNKGCFLGDTTILRADGTGVAIHDVREGDELLAFDAEGQLVHTTVQSVLSLQVEEYLVVTTEKATLKVTPEHPFYVGEGAFRTIESLRVGDFVYACDASGLSPQRIVSMTRIQGPATVYNLQTDRPHTFFANGIAVHNKGGGGGGFGGGGFGGGGFHGGGGYYGGGYSGSPGPAWFPWLFTAVVVGCVLYWVVKNNRASRDEENLDYTFRPGAVAAKAAKTRKLLEFIAAADPVFNVDALTEVARSTFLKLQECWQARDYGPMKPLLMPDLYVQHCQQIANMVHQHEINLLDGLAIERVDLVHVRYPHDADQREFTALITARARDYYVEDSAREFLRGDWEVQQFQEFWTFQLQGGKWLLREIEQTRESDVLKEENFFEPFTDLGRDHVYGREAGKSGPAGPWLESPAQQKATRIDRLLNFLVQTDKLWDRQPMLERARQVFMDVYSARESGNLDAVKDADLFPEIAMSLRDEIRARQQKGTTMEFRNLCIRKAELILVRNYADNSKDEYTVRISAHAQQVISRSGQVLFKDDDVRPFEEYWSFGRLDNAWKLKEVLPPAQGQKEINMENLDEDSSPAQLQWYYKQTRAV